MPTQSRNKNRRSSQHRKNIPSRKQSSKIISGNGVSGRIAGRGADNATERIYRPSHLNWPVTEVSPFKINEQNLSITHRDLEQELPLIYECLLSAPGFKDDKEWSVLPSLQQLADYLFQKVSEVIPKDYKWNLHGHWQGEYAIMYYNPMPELERDMMYMPLEWIQDLKKSRPDLVRLAMAMIGKISHCFQISLVENEFNDMFIHDIESFLEGDEEIDEFRISDAFKYRKYGEVYNFIKQCRQLSSIYPEKVLENEIKNYTPIVQRDREIKKWLLKGCKALENQFSIYDWSYAYQDPECNDGTPIMPYHVMTFEWSFYDEVFKHTEGWINDTYSQIGNVEPVSFGRFSPGGHTEPEDVVAFKNLSAFFDAGRKIFFKHFEYKYKKYYDNRIAHL